MLRDHSSCGRYNKDIQAIVKRSGLTVVTHKTVHFGTTHYYVLRK